jgi:endonuclease IV
MRKIGLKLWSINSGCYHDEAKRLYAEGIFDYIELYVVPGGLDLKKWEKLNIPFVVHCPHFAHGFNLAKSEKKENNLKIFEQVKKYADALNVLYIIFHGGIDGSIEETAIQLASFNEKRALIENKPYIALPNRMRGDFCRGYNPDEIKTVKEVANCGFCLDFGHAIILKILCNSIQICSI